MSFSFDDVRVAPLEGLGRLPVYLLLDVSASMQGLAVEALQRGVEQCLREIRVDTLARQTVYVGIIVFADQAQLITDGLEPVEQIEPPVLVAGGNTALGKAFRVLAESLERDVRRPVLGGPKGDWRPLVFILTDGRPTDDWRGARDHLLKTRAQRGRVFNVITVGCGPAIDEDTLKAIALDPGATFRMDKEDASFAKFFRWVGLSASRTVDATSRLPAGPEQPLLLPDASEFGLTKVQ